jgi:hypothetical protein
MGFRANRWARVLPHWLYPIDNFSLNVKQSPIVYLGVSMHKFFAGAAASALLLTAAATSATASVRYDFTAFSSLPVGSPAETFSGSFSYIAPDFITPNTTVPLGDLTSCSVIGSLGPATCRDQFFSTGLADGHETIGFGVSGVSGGPAIFYYFAGTPFGAAGTYETDFFGDDQRGELVVTDLGPSGGIPEPDTWSLMIAGFGLAGAALRRRGARQPA